MRWKSAANNLTSFQSLDDMITRLSLILIIILQYVLSFYKRLSGVLIIVETRVRSKLTACTTCGMNYELQNYSRVGCLIYSCLCCRCQLPRH